MSPNLKPLSRQTVVITGASSGIGLETACRAAHAGARVFLIARGEPALKAVCEEIGAQGCEAAYYAADMGVEAGAEAAAKACIDRFGGFDTWVNGAGVGAYERLAEMSDEDHRRLFDTNYYGVVHGSRAAVRHLAGREDGGALINIGSILSEIALPMMGAYSASKHAVAGYTDALRMELMDSPVSVTLIKPSSIDTPFAEHARNTMDEAARVPPPVYRPAAVAEAVLAAATHPHREITVGAGGAVMSATAKLLPRISDRLYAQVMGFLMRSRSEPNAGRSSLHAAGGDGTRRGPHRGVVPLSPFTHLQTNAAGRLAMSLAGIAMTALLLRRYAIVAHDTARWVRDDRAPMKEAKRKLWDDTVRRKLR